MENKLLESPLFQAVMVELERITNLIITVQQEIEGVNKRLDELAGNHQTLILHSEELKKAVANETLLVEGKK